jgi:SAM-dependent methyltransferase
VTMNFGIHHLARPETAFAEARRVLRPGGGYAFSSWTHAPDHGPIAVAEAAVQPHADPNVELPPGPDFLQFSDRDESERALAAAGFDPSSFRFETIRNVWRLADPGQLFEAQLEGGVRMSALLRAQPPERLERIRVAIGEAMEEYDDGEGGYALPVAAHIVSARTS